MDILIVDDDDDLAFLVEQFLTSGGYSVRRAANGEQGLAVLREQLPALVLLDVEMPLLDGPGMAERLFVEDLGKENVPIVVVSGAQGLKAIAARVGTPYFLAKPFLPHALLSVVRRALAERRVPRPPL